MDLGGVVTAVINGVRLEGVYWPGEDAARGADPHDWQVREPSMPARYAAKALGVSKQTVRRWSTRGYLRFFAPDPFSPVRWYHAGDVADLVIKLKPYPRTGGPLITRLSEGRPAS